jgi:hypothetical protein
MLICSNFILNLQAKLFILDITIFISTQEANEWTTYKLMNEPYILGYTATAILFLSDNDQSCFITWDSSLKMPIIIVVSYVLLSVSIPLQYDVFPTWIKCDLWIEMFKFSTV